jgi:hypothetical protein
LIGGVIVALVVAFMAPLFWNRDIARIKPAE